MLITRSAASDPLPAALQADLLVKLAGYDRNMRTRAGADLRILIVTNNGDTDPTWALQVKVVLGGFERIAGLAHSESIVKFTRADALAATCRADHIAIVMLSPSLVGEGEHIRASFDGVNVLTVTPDQELVRRGVVLGFELVSGKPKLFLNRTQANRQSVALSAEVMKLMTLYP